MLELTRNTLSAKVGAYRNLRTIKTILCSTLCGNDNHTIRGTDTIKSRSSLTLKHVDALNILWIDINTTVGIVGTCNRRTGIEVGCSGNRHTVNYIKWLVVTVE